MHVFFIPDLPHGGGDVSADDDERNHIRSRRLRPQETVRLIDGKGGYAEGAYLGDSRFHAGPRQEEESSGPNLSLVQARLPAEKLDWSIQKSVELGANRIFIYHSERSGLGKKKLERADRWARIVREACKQCGRASFPVVEACDSLGEALVRAENSKFFLADASGGVLKPGEAAIDAALIVGPEGGLTSEEIGAAEAVGATKVALGPWILRSETVAPAGLALLQYAYRLMSSESR